MTGPTNDIEGVTTRALRQRRRRLVGRLPPLESVLPGSLIERIGRAFQQRHDAQKALGNAGCLFGNTIAEGGMQDPEMARVLETFVRRGERILVSTFEDAVRSGELPKGTDVHALALFLITVSQGALLLGQGRPHLFEQMAPSLMRVIGSAAFTES